MVESIHDGWSRSAKNAVIRPGYLMMSRSRAKRMVPDGGETSRTAHNTAASVSPTGSSPRSSPCSIARPKAPAIAAPASWSTSSLRGK